MWINQYLGFIQTLYIHLKTTSRLHPYPYPYAYRNLANYNETRNNFPILTVLGGVA